MNSILNDLFSFFGISSISSVTTFAQLIETFLRVGVGLALIVLFIRCFFWVCSKF